MELVVRGGSGVPVRCQGLPSVTAFLRCCYSIYPTELPNVDFIKLS
jgi:hypothetical protein